MTPFGARTPVTHAVPVDVVPRRDHRLAVDDYFDLGDETTASANRSGMPFSLFALLRYKWSMAAVFLLIAGLAIPAIWLLVVPLYEAQAVIRVSPVGTKIAFQTENNGMLPFYTSFLNSQINIIRSREVLDKVLDHPQVQKTAWYQDPAKPLLRSPLTRMERLRDALMARPRSNTELIDVSMSARDGDDAQLIVDTVVDEYLRLTAEELRRTDRERVDALEAENGLRHTEITRMVNDRSSLAMDVGTSDPATRLAQANDLLLQFITERNGLKRDLELAKARRTDMLAAAPDGDDGQAEAKGESAEPAPAAGGDASEGGSHASPRFSSDADWRRLETNVKNARHTLESSRQQYGPSHPRMTALTRDVEYAESLLRTREEQLVEQWKEAPFGVPDPGTTVVADTTSLTLTMLEQRIKELERDIEYRDSAIKDQRKEVERIGEIAKEVARIDEDLTYKRETRNQLMNRIEVLTLEQKAPARISIAGRAVAPSRPSKDRRPIFSAMAFCGAIAAAMALGYLRLMSDQRVHEVGEARKTSSAPFLGQLPTLPTTREILPSCTTAIMEDVRMVRTALLERINGSHGGAAVLVTSSSAQAGKTSVSILLAQSLAALGKRTLLVEADLRNPSLADRLNINGRAAGLMTVLTRNTPDEAAITRSRKFDFDVVTAGEAPDGFDADLLANGTMSAALSRWRQKYDVVLLDSPPVLAVADVRILGGLCDGTMMVMRSAHCRRADVMESYALLAAGGCTLVGTVLVGGTRRAGYSAYYGAYGRPGTNGPAPRQLAAAPDEEKDG
jgi:capsular exopolysaccharide synthesis family protein